VEIRALGDDDVAAVLELNRAEVPRLGPLDAGLLGRLRGMPGLALVAVEGGRLAGFAIALEPGAEYRSPNYRFFTHRGGSFLYVDRIAVAPDARRRGVAGALYDRIEAHARTIGSAELTCEVNLRPPSPESLAFHLGRGFAEVGRQDTADDVRVVLLAHRLDTDEPVSTTRRRHRRRCWRDGSGPRCRRRSSTRPRCCWPPPTRAATPMPGSCCCVERTMTGCGSSPIDARPRGVSSRPGRPRRRSCTGASCAARSGSAVRWPSWTTRPPMPTSRRGRAKPSSARGRPHSRSRSRTRTSSGYGSPSSSDASRAVTSSAPPHWGGYLLRPEVVEFWRMGDARMHERLRYVRDGDAWRRERLQP
jgi:uncharacterized protein